MNSHNINHHSFIRKMILTACGAKVVTRSSIQSTISLDCCLFNSADLPPRVTSIPVDVSNVLKFIDDSLPLLDLAWAHQSIIQRKCLPLSGDVRYSVSLVSGMSNKIFSLKSKSNIRFEVGDLVQFTRGPKAISRGRILAIIWGGQGKSCQLEIQMLDTDRDYELIDCPSSPKIVVDESSLQGNIVMLKSKDFHCLGYLPQNPAQSNIFRQIIPSNSSPT